jgi:hypothetical protein
MPRLERLGVVAALLVTLSGLTLAVAPVISAAKPERTVLGAPDPFVLPAGSGCSFDVYIKPHDDLRIMDFTFHDGRSVRIEHGSATLTNPESGASFEHHPAFHSVDTFDASTNEIVDVTQGRVAFWFLPGDMGPDGLVSEPGLFRVFIGSIKDRSDADTGVITQFSFVGSFIDVCAQLA